MLLKIALNCNGLQFAEKYFEVAMQYFTFTQTYFCAGTFGTLEKAGRNITVQTLWYEAIFHFLTS